MKREKVWPAMVLGGGGLVVTAVAALVGRRWLALVLEVGLDTDLAIQLAATLTRGAWRALPLGMLIAGLGAVALRRDVALRGRAGDATGADARPDGAAPTTSTSDWPALALRGLGLTGVGAAVQLAQTWILVVLNALFGPVAAVGVGTVIAMASWLAVLMGVLLGGAGGVLTLRGSWDAGRGVVAASHPDAQHTPRYSNAQLAVAVAGVVVFLIALAVVLGFFWLASKIEIAH